MKLFLSFIVMFCSASVFAEKDVCADYFVCGTYKMNWTTTDGQAAVTTVTITSTSTNSAEFKYMTSVNGTTPDGWDLAVQFETDGSFKMTDHGVNYANGICSDKICTYGMHPWIPQGSKDAVGNAGMLRFTDNQLQYALIVGTPPSLTNDLQVFDKQ